MAGRLTRLTWPGGSLYADYDYLVTGEVTKIRENGATSGIGVLAAYTYDSLGRRTGVTRGNGTITSYGFDAASRLTSLSQDLASTTSDVTTTLAYNPASEIVSQTRNNDAYAWPGRVNVNRGYTTNGLNQYTTSGANTLTYDGRGNLATSQGVSYSYTTENRLATAGSVSLSYDPIGRLKQVVGFATTRFDYIGDALIAELDGSNAVLRRYVPGPGQDEPIVWYEGSGLTNRRWLHADERGSVTAITDASGAAIQLNSYDEYGIPASTNLGRFQYTGQTFLPEIGMYYYKARIYSPTLGRFLQTDPIGYGDGLNMYAYVGNNPVNRADPSGNCGATVWESIGQSCYIYTVNGGDLGYWRYNEVGLEGAPINQGYGWVSTGSSGYSSWIFQPSDPLQGRGLLNLASGTAPAQQSIWSGIKNAICHLPALAGGGGVDAYDVAGGSITGGGSFNPRNGQISFAFDLGVGLGIGGGARYITGSAFGVAKADGTPSPVFSAGINANGTAVAGPVGGTASYQLLGSSPGDWSAAYTRGAEATVNGNISAHAQANLPGLYNLGC